MKGIMKASGAGLLVVASAVAFAFGALAKPHPATRTTTLRATTMAPTAAVSVSDLSGTFMFRLVPAESFAPFLNPLTCPNAPDAGVCSAPRQDILRVGVITFDGNGNVTGHTIATTDDGQTTVVKDFNFNGTYTVNPDGTGTLSISPTMSIPDEGAETYSFVFVKGDVNRAGTVDLTETDNDGGGAKIFLTGKATSATTTALSSSDLSDTFAFRFVPAESFAPFLNPSTCPNAPNAGVCSAPRQDILRVGIITFDGNGNVTGHALATTDDGQTTVVKDFNFNGTYTINPDGTGTLSIAPTTSIPDEGPETYSFVLNKGGANRPSTVDLAETDNAGGGAKIFLTGTATSTAPTATPTPTPTATPTATPTPTPTAVPNVPTRKSQCKNGGWRTLQRADGTSFKNQGDCIQYVNTGK
jgi:hypothetical protein